MKIVLFDLETAPLLGYAFGLYEQNILHVVRNPYILCFAYKELGQKGIMCKSIWDYPLYKKDPYDDSALLKDLHDVIESADVLIAHNGDNFDIKVANGRFIAKGLKPISEKISIDTLKEARKKFKLPSNKLTDLATYAGLGQKKETGKKLWIDCINGDKKAQKLMDEYCIHDVRLLEGIYYWMRPWMKTHPNLNILARTVAKCPVCLSGNHKKDGYAWKAGGKYQRFICQDCGHPFRGIYNLVENKPLVK